MARGSNLDGSRDLRYDLSSHFLPLHSLYFNLGLLLHESTMKSFKIILSRYLQVISFRYLSFNDSSILIMALCKGVILDNRAFATQYTNLGS